MTNHPIQSLIIDDEPNNINLLQNMLRKHCPEVTVTSTESDALKGLKLIEALQPALVFLDIQMPKLNGFELLKKLEPIHFEVIFVTAFAEFAIEAFDYHAIGYVSKPIAAKKLKEAVDRAKLRIEEKQSKENIFSMIESRMHQQEETKIPLSTMTGLLFVNKEEIMYCESSGNYTYFFMKDGKKIMVSRQLGEYEKLMTDTFFVRIHDKYIINLKYVTEYIKGRGGEIKLNNLINLPVSINRKDNLMARFEKWLKR